MESEDIELVVSSRAHATAAPIRPFVTGGDETTEQEVPESKRQRTVAGLPVCSILILVDEIPVELRCHTRDRRQTMTPRQSERYSPHLVKVGRQTEQDAMTRHELFERVPIAMARGKKVRCQWLDEMKEGSKWTIPQLFTFLGAFVCTHTFDRDVRYSVGSRLKKIALRVITIFSFS